jgi:hypothetical protein
MSAPSVDPDGGSKPAGWQGRYAVGEPFGASSSAPLPDHVVDVFDVRTDPQMTHLTARWIVSGRAIVEYVGLVLWNLVAGHCPGHPVRKMSMVVVVNPSIPLLVQPSLENQAAGFLVPFKQRPESLLEVGNPDCVTLEELHRLTANHPAKDVAGLGDVGLATTAALTKSVA